MRRDHAFQFWLAVLAMGVAVALASLGSPDRYWFAVLFGLGLGFMILAVIVLGVIVHDETQATAKRREMRIQLAAYVQAGQRVISLCHATEKARVAAPESAASEWGQTVFDYLREKLGDDYAVRFDNPAGLSLGMTVLSPPYSNIETYARARLARLNEIMQELAT